MDEKTLSSLGILKEEYEKIQEDLKRDPNMLELYLYSVMWSEHCSYKHSCPFLRHLPIEGERVLQGPGGNAGVVDIGSDLALAMKVESHNHPSAIAPYQGAATGVGGIIRDILAMGAFPISLLDSLSFGQPENNATRYLIKEVVRGIADYGNCVGIPTVAGEIHFDPSYSLNPLVNVMCVGLMKKESLTEREVRAGDLVFLVGNLTGRDGIGGASFASRELKEEEDRSPIQVGDPFLERLLIEALLEALDKNLVLALQDLGAAGLTSASSELAARFNLGMEIDTSLVPLRDATLLPYEVMISESQERMLLLAKEENKDSLDNIFSQWGLKATIIGKVTDDSFLKVKEKDQILGNVPIFSLTSPPQFIPDRIIKTAEKEEAQGELPPIDLEEALLNLLSSPNISSKQWAFQQYDHTIQTNTILPPGPSDAAVLRIKGESKAIALTLDSNGRLLSLDPRRGAEMVVAEAARNLVSSGAEPIAITDCLNLGSPEDEQVVSQLAEMVDGLAQASLSLQIPVISGNVSLYNEQGEKAIWPTLTIGMVGLIERLEWVTSPSFKEDHDLIFLLGKEGQGLGGSELQRSILGTLKPPLPDLDLMEERRCQRAVLEMIRKGIIKSAHDIGEGGLAVALAESCLFGGKGAHISFQPSGKIEEALFGEGGPAFLISLNQRDLPLAREIARLNQIPLLPLGEVQRERLQILIQDKKIVDLPLTLIKERYMKSLPELLEGGLS